ncbi:unnamed protein product [Mytilus edulis]|uniref:Uncharacterized protein n=1 Tax=Mytilus edulis TaxID=6550 RepID=A0A8S3RUY0_MYTED|nr:unnamed protein product [Mytilus edulis]
MDQVKPKIIEIVDDRIQPYIDTITQNKDALILQEAEMKKQSDEIKSLKSKLVKVESRIEEQEQYSRRTSLRFHNVPVPTDNNGAVITPIDTDDLVLRICNKKLKVKLNIFDIGRSHPIGEMKDGKISIIVRFLSYRQRNMVFSNKKQLKNNLDKIFIAENLTKHRYDLINRLNTLPRDYNPDKRATTHKTNQFLLILANSLHFKLHRRSAIIQASNENEK